MIAMADLPDDIDALKAMIVAQGEQNARLETLVAALRQALFGRKSEKAYPDQFELALEDIEAGIAQVEADGDTNPLVTPTQDMVIGAYYLTALMDGEKGEGRAFGDVDTVAEKMIQLYDMGIRHVGLLQNFGNMPRPVVEASMRRIAEEVMPRVQAHIAQREAA